MKKQVRPAALSTVWLRAILVIAICGAGLMGYAWLDTSQPAAQVSNRDLVITRIMDRTVRVEVEHGFGTGNLVTRKTQDGRTVHLVLTAAHVVESCRSVVPGLAGPYIKWLPCKVSIPVYQEGQLVGIRTFAADVVQYSNKDTGQDLALLLVHAEGFTSATTEFYLDKRLPGIGQELLHVGCMFGDFHSFTTGVLSQYGRTILGRLFDQTTTIIYPGSSGGGLFLPDGRYIGMASMLRTGGVGFVTPIRRILEWSTKAGCRWVLDPGVQAPSLDKLTQWSVENDGSALPLPAACDEPDPEG